MTRVMTRRLSWIDLALGALLASVLFAVSFRRGWNRVETDFPNYYTAAVAARHGLPLADFYDWTWFQREMNYTGTERQLGAYTPQSPLALLPFLPLSGLPPQRAKQVWLTVNALLLACTVWLLAGVSGLSYRWLFLILLAGLGSLHANFVLGQYYVFLTFLLTLSVWCLFRGRDISAGELLGILFALKLYSGPFALFFLVKRRWRAAAGFIGIAALFALLSVAMFGWEANKYYAESVLPRVMNGTLIDPYHPGQGSMTALLRRTFVSEPELNPRPAISFPPAFTFLRAVFTCWILAFTLLVLRKHRDLTKREFAWLVITLLLLAPVNATYDFTLLAVPVALLLPECALATRILVLAGLAVLGAPLPQSVLVAFPRAFVLAALFIWSGWPGFRGLSKREVGFAAALGLLIALFATAGSTKNPERAIERLVQPGYSPGYSIAAMAPAVSSTGLIYQGFGDGRYILHTPTRSYPFEGHAFHPAASPFGSSVIFELVSHGHSRLFRLDPETGGTEAITGAAITGPELDPQEPAISADGSRIAFTSRGYLWIRELRIRERSGQRNLGVAGSEPSFTPDASHLLFAHDGRILSLAIDSGEIHPLIAAGAGQSHPVMSPDGAMLAFSAASHGTRQIWMQQFPAGNPLQLTSENCNHDSPVWEADSRHLIFTSDCGRGLGLPGLYRATAIETQGPR